MKNNLQLVRMDDYRHMAFSSETPKKRYQFMTVLELVKIIEELEEDIINVYSIGVLYSKNGHYFLKDLPTQESNNDCSIQLAAVYLKKLPKSAVLPYTIQVYGELQWRNKPVLFATIMQPLHPDMALKLHTSLTNIKTKHSATKYNDKANGNFS